MRRPIVAGFRTVIRVYFRSIQSIGAVPAATVGGRVFVANHHNALVDPILILTDAPCAISPVAKSTLWKIPGLRWLLDATGAVPIVRRQDAPDKSADSNDDAFAKIAQHLACGGNILIFPEGISHAEPSLAPLRSGAARMLLAAHALAPAAALSFQAVALEFDERDMFRSRTALLWGPPRLLADVATATVDAAIAANAADATEDGNRDAVATIVTAQMAHDLRGLIIESASGEDRLLVGRVAQLVTNATLAAVSATSLGDELAVARIVATLGQQVQTSSPAHIDAVRIAVQAYFAALGSAELRDVDVAQPDRRRPLGELLRLGAAAPLALVGLLLYALPYPLPRLIARRADDADMVSTLKLGVAVLMYPLYASVLVVLALWLWPGRLAAVAATAAVVSPFVTVWWLDRWQQRPGRLATRSSEIRTLLVGLRATACQEVELAHAHARLMGA